MTFIVTVLLYIFGLDAATGKLNTTCSTDANSTTTSCSKDIKIDATGNILIYDPEYNSSTNPVYFKSPNIVIPNPHNNDYTSHNKKVLAHIHTDTFYLPLYISTQP